MNVYAINPTNMQHKKILKDEIIINALASKVWSVLTLPEYTMQYMFDNAVVSEWENDSSITPLPDNEKRPGRNTGNVLEVVPGISLVFTIPDPTERAKEDILAYYELLPEDNGIRLKMHSEFFIHNEEQLKLYKESWQMILQKIKWLSEYS